MTALLAAIALLAAAVAQAPAAPVRPRGPCITPPSPQMQADKATYGEAMTAFRTGGFAALRERRAAIAAVLAHAPPGLGPEEDCGNQIVIHPSSPAQSLLWLMMAANESKKTGDTRRVVATGVPVYVQAALLMGSLQNEDHQYEAAAVTLKQALVWQPRDPLISIEAAGALALAKHDEEALALCDTALEGLIADNAIKARLQRRRGFVLVEMRRLDEAEAAYRLSIVLEPTDAVGPRELAYVLRQKGGAAPTAPELISPGPPTPPKVPPAARPAPSTP